MSATHRPDYEAIRKDYEAMLKESPVVKRPWVLKFREAYMWPDINVEDLIKGKTLLLLLNSRGRNTPQMFAHADFQATRVGRISGACWPPFLIQYYMLLEGEAVETYGRLVFCDDDENARIKTFMVLPFYLGLGS